MARARKPIPHGGETMQIDALVDHMEDLGDLGPGAELPPPLPPKKTSRLTWIVGVVVVLVAAGLGIGAGWILLGGGEEPGVAPAAHPSPAAPAVPAESDVVQMDEVVFDTDPADPAEAR